MSDTPITDAAAFMEVAYGEVVEAEVSRKIEKRLAHALASNVLLAEINRDLARKNTWLTDEIEKHFLATQPAES